MGLPLSPATRRRLTAAAVALVTLALCAEHAAPGALEGIAFLLPALLLALTLAARRYPGERALVALVAGRAPPAPRRPPRPRPLAARPPPPVLPPRGGLVRAAPAGGPPPPPPARPS